MNFVAKVKKGQEGKNKGLSTGLKPLDRAMDGIQKRSIYCVAAAPKVGKTTLVDFCFMLEPYLYYLEYKRLNPDSPLRINWIYFSFEIDRVKKELKFAAYFMFKDYGIANFWHNGTLYAMSARYLEGRLTDMDDNVILLQPDHFEKLKEIYEKRIIPIFGRYDENGNKLTNGVIDFIEERDNPTGLRNYLFSYAKENGEFIEVKYKTTDDHGSPVVKTRITGYKEKDPNLVTIIITDHMRKLKRERGYVMKENIDKWVEYQVEFRNWCSFTFVDVIHINRNISNIERIKFLSEFLYPTGEDVKDTGNLSEEADYIITLFNPQDEKYKITKHFKLELEGYPYYRSIHLVESRDTNCPEHMQVNMFGAYNVFSPIINLE